MEPRFSNAVKGKLATEKDCLDYARYLVPHIDKDLLSEFDYDLGWKILIRAVTKLTVADVFEKAFLPSFDGVELPAELVKKLQNTPASYETIGLLAGVESLCSIGMERLDRIQMHELAWCYEAPKPLPTL